FYAVGAEHAGGAEPLGSVLSLFEQHHKAGVIMNRIFMSDERADSRISIDRILHPRRVAVLGASDSVAKFGGRIMHFLTRHGFEVDVYTIYLRRETVAGRKAYSNIGAVPTAPDVAIMAVPTDTLVASLQEVADAGVGCSVIITNGFAE